MRRYTYLTEDFVARWGRHPATPIGEIHFHKLQPNSRAHQEQANEASEQQEEDGSHTSRATLSGSSSDILETGDGREEGVRILPCTVGD